MPAARQFPARPSVVAVLLIGSVLPGMTGAAEDALPWDSQRVETVLQSLAATPSGVGPRIADRAAWQEIARLPGLQGIVAQAESLLKQSIPELTDELYLDFSRTGNRTRCQRVISQRHGRVSTLVLAECVEDQGRFLPAIEEAILAVCDERSWLLPAHDRNQNNYYGRTIEIDLNSAATSWNLATANFWLGDRLSTAVRDRIRRELERRTFAPLESYVKTGEPRLWWATGTNNWNAVCLAGVTGAALATIEEPSRRAFFIAAAEHYVQNFLQGFTADGYCSEGLGYWNYGFGHFVMLSETIRRATGGGVDLMADPRVKAIARFGVRMEILPGVFPAFADCSPSARPDPQILACVDRRFQLGWNEARREAAASAGSSRALFELALLDLPNAQQAGANSAGGGGDTLALRDWFPDAGILICRPAGDRRDAMGVALKGGHNAEHHNHNDVGSFVVAWRGGTPIVDPGSEQYTARTFSSRRYESGVLNSFGHSVPRVAGQLQRNGRAAAAKIVRTEFTDTQDTLVLDLRDAYA
ncbi:MAG: heparinase II/III-family protein, partial [Planctomycetes bacterium]|nr:heparinase II/III-family protein [Planctomycetota bacterium]